MIYGKSWADELLGSVVNPSVMEHLVRGYLGGAYTFAENLFGAGLGLLWNAGGMALYLLFGDDDEEREKMLQEIALRGSMDVLQGIPFGDMIVDITLKASNGNVRNIQSPQLMLINDIENVVNALNSDAVKGANDLMNMLISAGVGVDTKTLTDVLVAMADNRDWGDPEELGLFALRVMSAPQSQLDRLMADDAMENGAANLEDVAKRYMEYKKMKDTPLTGWKYSDEGEQKALEKYGKRFATYLDERMENIVEDNEEFDVFYNSSDAEVKKVLSSMRQQYLAGDDAEGFKKFGSYNLVKDALAGEGIDGLEYYELTNSEDVDADFLFMSTFKKLQEVKDEFNDLDPANKEVFYNSHKEELDLYLKLNNLKRNINNNKKRMKELPEEAQEAMNIIRELRTRAIELINNYNNE